MSDQNIDLICRECGKPMSRNPHPHAGEPATLLTVGAVYECIPCQRRLIHQWSARALKAETQLTERDAALRHLIAECESAIWQIKAALPE